jgi:uncharacterized protein YjbJ (UPF0337 family)
MKGKIQQKWGGLTDDDLTYKEGQANELIGRIQEKRKRTSRTLLTTYNRRIF